jgi:hypothetical protein
MVPGRMELSKKCWLECSLGMKDFEEVELKWRLFTERKYRSRDTPMAIFIDGEIKS